MNYVVMCRVSGGITGTREAILKRDGVPQYFATREAAQTEATRLNDRMNNPYSHADFRYWVEER